MDTENSDTHIHTYSNYILNLPEYSRNFVAFSRPLLNAVVVMMILQMQRVHSAADRLSCLQA